MTDESYVYRVQVEQTLMRLVEAFDECLGDSYRRCHDSHGDVITRLAWAQRVELISDKERRIWQDALVVRNAILARDFRIVLEDISWHINQLAPLAAALPQRITDLGSLK